MIKSFKKLTVARKIIVFLLLVCAASALLESNKGWVSAFFLILIAYFTVRLGQPQSAEYAQNSNDDWHLRQQEEEEEDASLRSSEEDRLDEENKANQEALDRLL